MDVWVIWIVMVFPFKFKCVSLYFYLLFLEVVMSAVLKENYVETIFDHGVTDAELSELMLESKNDTLGNILQCLKPLVDD